MDYPISVPNIGWVGGKFVNEDSFAGTPGSLIPAQWGNAVTDEIVNVITGAGLVPTEANVTQLLAAIRLINKQPVILNATGPANAYAAVNSPALTALPANGYVQRLLINTANTGPSTYAPDGLTAKPIYGLGLLPLQGGELPGGIAVLRYVVQASVNSGNGAWIIVDAPGGRMQIPQAATGNQAMRLDQAIGRLINVRVFDSTVAAYAESLGTRSIYVRLQAGGGGGGGAPAPGGSGMSMGGAGGAGSYAEAYFTSGFSGAAITLPPGGVGGNGVSGATAATASFGSLLSCPGGVGGGVAGPSASGFIVASAPSNNPSGGATVNSRGPGSEFSISLGSSNGQVGKGGASIFGPGGASSGVPTTPGSASPSPGAGGGGTALLSGASPALGGQGGGARCVIYEFS